MRRISMATRDELVQVVAKRYARGDRWSFTAKMTRPSRTEERRRGAGRLEGLEAAAALAQLYSTVRMFVYLFQRSFKLAGKERDGARVRKRYHPAACTNTDEAGPGKAAMPVAPIARQPRSLQREHGTDAALADCRQKLFEAGPACAPARSAKIVIDHLDVGPPHLAGPIGQAILPPLAFQVLATWKAVDCRT